MLKPLLADNSLNLVFEPAEELSPLFTDEQKVSQVLRNFISNAVKFTQRGEVRVCAREIGSSVEFSVSDTGIGISEVDQKIIFEEFAQVDTSMQRKVKGTGLGLPLSRKLAELLGGRVEVSSTVGVGSTFRLCIPKVYLGADKTEELPLPVFAPGSKWVLIIEDNHRDSKRPITVAPNEMIDSVLAIFRSAMMSNGIRLEKRLRASRP